jgi:hypothetical protein
MLEQWYSCYQKRRLGHLSWSPLARTMTHRQTSGTHVYACTTDPHISLCMHGFVPHVHVISTPDQNIEHICWHLNVSLNMNTTTCRNFWSLELRPVRLVSMAGQIGMYDLCVWTSKLPPGRDPVGEEVPWFDLALPGQLDPPPSTTRTKGDKKLGFGQEKLGFGNKK